MVASLEAVERVIGLCRAAAAANRQTRARQGSVIELTPENATDLMITADLHGQRLNFQKLCRIADLAAHPRRHLVLQEVCHGGPRYPSDWGCMSHLLLEDVAELKVTFPQQVHFLLSNHELAELTDHPIAKAGRMLNLQFRSGMQEMYGPSAAQVRQAYGEFLSSCPLAARLSNGIFVCHGSPAGVDQKGFDTQIFSRPLTPTDCRSGGAAFQLVWGRDFRPENGAAFANALGAEIVVHGHEPCANGAKAPNPWQIILDCSGPQACYLLVPVAEKLSHEQLCRSIRRLYP